MEIPHVRYLKLRCPYMHVDENFFTEIIRPDL
jgi:hypothetical protein